MARISGVELPGQKRIEFALTAIHGIGRATAAAVCEQAGIERGMKAKDLTDEQISKLRDVIESEYTVEGELRSEVSLSIKRLKDIKSYRGIRHIKHLPVRGQRTRTNSRTVRGGGRKTVAGKKRVVAKK
jgi:small subunit ribosomal protein S13